jgi:hypothetical protein
VTVTCVIGHMTPFTVANATNICTAKGRTFTDGDRVRVMNSGGALPAGLAKETDYYVRDVSGSTFKLAATSGGTAIDITDDGQGTHFASNPSAGFGDVEGPRAAIKLLAAHWYENREGSRRRGHRQRHPDGDRGADHAGEGVRVNVDTMKLMDTFQTNEVPNHRPAMRRPRPLPWRVGETNESRCDVCDANGIVILTVRSSDFMAGDAYELAEIIVRMMNR